MLRNTLEKKLQEGTKDSKRTTGNRNLPMQRKMKAGKKSTVTFTRFLFLRSRYAVHSTIYITFHEALLQWCVLIKEEDEVQ